MPHPNADRAVGLPCQHHRYDDPVGNITRIGWAQTIGIEPASDLIAAFLIPGEVQIIGPDRNTGDGDREVLSPLQNRLLNFVAQPRPAVLLVHPETNQMQHLTRGALDAERAFVILWSADRTFEGWLAAQGSRNLASPEPPSPVDPVVVLGIAAVARSCNPGEGIRYGYGGDYAIDALRKLQRAGYAINGPGLEAPGFIAGLRWADVIQLRTYADRLAAGHQYRSGRDSYRADIVDLWRQASAPDRATADPTAKS